MILVGSPRNGGLAVLVVASMFRADGGVDAAELAVDDISAIMRGGATSARAHMGCNAVVAGGQRCGARHLCDEAARLGELSASEWRE